MIENNNTAPSPLQVGLTFVIGAICIGAALTGLFWLSKIIPSIYRVLTENEFSFMSNSLLFHLVWVVFFVSLLVTGIKLLISALKKRAKDLVPGLSLYFLGASLVVIGLFYLVFEQHPHALIVLIAGAFCIYIEGTTEIA